MYTRAQLIFEQLRNQRTYTSQLAQKYIRRGYLNMMGVRRDATINGELARNVFYRLETARSKMTTEQRQTLIACLDHDFIQRFPLEMPFDSERRIKGFSVSNVEIFYAGMRLLAFFEQVDPTSKLFRIVEIPFDCSDPEMYYNSLLADVRYELFGDSSVFEGLR